MRKYKVDKHKSEPFESVIYSAMMYCLYFELEDNKGILADVCSWCNPKLEYLSTELLKKIFDECAPRQKNSELWAKMLRHIAVILENREIEEGENAYEVCLQNGVESAKG